MFSRRHPAASRALAAAFDQLYPDFLNRFTIPGGRKNVLVKKAEQLGPRRRARVDRLETDQKRRNVVAGLRVKPDLLNQDGLQRTAAIR